MFKKLLLSLILVLSLCNPVFAQRTVYSTIQKSTFLTSFENAAGDPVFGTAFCVPGRSNQVITAGHAIQPGVWVTDWAGKKIEVKILLKDETKDIGILQLAEPACEFSPVSWAAKNAAPGDEAWLFGWGGVKEKPLLTRGIISSEVGINFYGSNVQAAQLNALAGHSGGAVMNPRGEVIGMLVGGFDAKDEMDLIVPVEVLKKVVK